MKMRVLIAIILCKLTRSFLRVIGRGGTTLPGRIALVVCPGLLSELSRGVKTVLITGTNGKTTSARMVEQTLVSSGASCFANRSGANLIGGITAEFASNASLTGRPRREYAVIECDEGAFKQVSYYVNPIVILVTNIFRDQLDRYGEISRTLENIKTGVMNAPDAKLCLNADCSLTASIAGDVSNEAIFFGVDTELYKDRVDELSDARRCIRCGGEYEYDYITYGHLGGFHCPRCGYSRKAPHVSITGVLSLAADCTHVQVQIFGEPAEAEISLPGGYNVYNAVGAISAAVAMGFTKEAATSAVRDFQCGFGRMERFEIEGRTVRMILVKNPAGCNQVLNFLFNIQEKALFVICLNDKIADGTDISWIWDVNFEKLLSMNARLSGIFISGERADDMALRLKYAGYPADKLEIIRDYGDLLKAMLGQELPVFVMPTYTAMLELRKNIAKEYGYKDFWE